VSSFSVRALPAPHAAAGEVVYGDEVEEWLASWPDPGEQDRGRELLLLQALGEPMVDRGDRRVCRPQDDAGRQRGLHVALRLGVQVASRAGERPPPDAGRDQPCS
jgi:hypothetical protein